MPNYEVVIIHEYKVTVEEDSEEEAEDIVKDMMDNDDPGIEYIGFEFETELID